MVRVLYVIIDSIKVGKSQQIVQEVIGGGIIGGGGQFGNSIVFIIHYFGIIHGDGVG